MAPVPDRIEKKLDGRERRARALLALPLRARPGAGGGRRGRAADRGGTRARTRSACWCARSRTRAPAIASALEERARAVPDLLARPPTSSAPRCATCWPGCARWPTRATPARWCARSRGRRSSCARWTSRGSPSSPAGASSTCRRAVGRGARGAAALPGGPRPRAGLPAPLPLGLERLRGPPPGRVRAAPDRAHRPAPPAGVRHPGRHGRAAAQHRQAVRARRAPTCAASRRPRARDFTRYLAAVAESGLREEEAAGRAADARRAGDDDARRQGARVRPRLRAGPVRGAHARPVPAARPTACRTSCSRRRCPPAASREAHEAEMRRLLHVAMTRARKGLVLAWAEGGPAGRHAAALAVLRGGARRARRRGGGLRGGAVRARRGTALDLPDHARRAARHGRARRRPARRDAARHLPRRGPGGVALPRADQGRGADRAREGGPAARRRADRGQRDPRCRAPRPSSARSSQQSALDDWLRDTERDPDAPARRGRATAPSRRSTRSSRAAARA